MALRIFDVRGDGNCYYRCIWNIVKNDVDACANLGLSVSLTEDQAVKALRRFVASKLEEDEFAQSMLRNIWELCDCIEDIDEQYPLAEKIKRCKMWDTMLKRACELISDTNIMASELEHMIISTALSSLHIVTLARSSFDTLADIAEKWLLEMNVLLPKVEKPKVAIIINQDYIHYKYMKFHGHAVNMHGELYDYVKERMAESDVDDDE